ncbi:MAG TPA: DUF3122 domain-containing protein [Elainellaceae cyanobacterium]
MGYVTSLGAMITSIQNRKAQSWIGQCLLRGIKIALGLMLIGAIVGVFALPASAVILAHEEAPGKILYKSQWSLRDQHQQPWQAIAFKQVYPDHERHTTLRFVGFPDAVAIDHSQPISLSNSIGQALTLPDQTEQIFGGNDLDGNKSDRNKSNAHPPIAASVGQYDIQHAINEFRPDVPLDVSIATLQQSEIHLNIPPWLIQEWQTLTQRH